MSKPFVMNELPAEALAKGKAKDIDFGKNFMVIYDKETGEVLNVANNLVVYSGRRFALRKLFSNGTNSITNGKANLDSLNATSVCLFGIGTGGTPANNPFEVINPTAVDVDLNTAIPFRVTSTSTGVELSADEAGKYHDGRTAGGSTSYYKKRFEEIELGGNPAEDEVYVKMTLEISEKDARGGKLSELALYSAKNTNNNYSAFEMFSRITFETEPLNEKTNKALVIAYYVYC